MRRSLCLRLAVAVLALPLSACEGGGSQPPASYCATSADCPGGMVCEFSATAGCSGQGQCAVPEDVPCPAQPVCSCAGATTATCVVGGYTLNSPVRSLGACEAGQAEADAAAADATAD